LSDCIIVFVTAGSEEVAERIGKAVVEERLAACANIVPGVRSIYRWKGRIEDDRELLIIMKTRAALFPRLRDRIRQLHTYEVPEIICADIRDGLPDYLKWIVDSTDDVSSPEVKLA